MIFCLFLRSYIRSHLPRYTPWYILLGTHVDILARSCAWSAGHVAAVQRKDAESEERKSAICATSTVECKRLSDCILLSVSQEQESKSVIWAQTHPNWSVLWPQTHPTPWLFFFFFCLQLSGFSVHVFLIKCTISVFSSSLFYFCLL